MRWLGCLPTLWQQLPDLTGALCGQSREHNYVPKVDEHKVKAQVGQKIQKWLKGLGGVVVPTPVGTINWAEVAESAIWRKPPFTFDPKDKENEKGFRDALILETVVSICKSGSSADQTVIFLCNDFLLRTAAEARLKGDKKFLAFESISDFQSYIQLTQQELTDKFVKSIQARARAKFFTAKDENCLYTKEKLRDRIGQEFKEDLNVLPTSSGVNALARLLNPASTQTLKKVAEKWWINATQFEQLLGDREFHWITRVTVAQLFEGASEGVGGLLGAPLPPESKIKLVELDVKWTAIFQDAKMVAHNVTTEQRVLPRELVAMSSQACSMTRFKRAFPGKPYGLENAMRHAGLTFTQTHRAMPDAMACRDLWIWMDNEGIPENPPVQTPKKKHPNPMGKSKRLELEDLGASMLSEGATFPNAGRPWESNSLQMCLQAARSGVEIPTLAASYGKTPLSIAKALLRAGIQIEEPRTSKTEIDSDDRDSLDEC